MPYGYKRIMPYQYKPNRSYNPKQTGPQAGKGTLQAIDKLPGGGLWDQRIYPSQALESGKIAVGGAEV